MGVTYPAFFILATMIGLVILFYMFRKQYQIMTIPSNLLWEQLMNEYQASPWLDKLQRNVLLLLQILILTSIMLALVRPFWMTEGVPGENVVIIVDRSASMSATHDGQSRFDEAKVKVKELLEKVNGQEVSVVVTGNIPELIVNRETNLRHVDQIIDELEITYESNYLEKAIQYASSLSTNETSSLFIFSDAVTKEAVQNVPDSYIVNVTNVGKEGINVSLGSFGVTKFEDEIIGIVLIENQSEHSVTPILQIHSDDQLIYEENVTLESLEQKVLRIPDLPEREYYKAQILVNDDYEVDNALTTIYQSSPSSIYLMGDVSPFIVRGLENIGPQVVQMGMEENDIDLSNAIVVVENIAPEQWPDRPILAITPSKKEEVPVEESITISDDPLLQYVDFDDVYINTAYKHDLNHFSTIADSGSIPLIEKGTFNGFPAIIVNFSIENSDWPLHTGFPIFLYHSFQWLTMQESFIGFFQPGEKRWINPDPDNADWKIYDEKGAFIDSYELDQESFQAPVVPGLYQAIVGDQSLYFAVQLEDEEKQIPANESFIINNVEHGAEQEQALRPNDQLWFWLTLFGLLLLFVEWEVTRRGARA